MKTHLSKRALAEKKAKEYLFNKKMQEIRRQEAIKRLERDKKRLVCAGCL